jgi:hypothetical protein
MGAGLLTGYWVELLLGGAAFHFRIIQFDPQNMFLFYLFYNNRFITERRCRLIG